LGQPVERTWRNLIATQISLSETRSERVGEKVVPPLDTWRYESGIKHLTICVNHGTFKLTFEYLLVENRSTDKVCLLRFHTVMNSKLVNSITETYE
jgi:hypothetical protein